MYLAKVQGGIRYIKYSIICLPTLFTKRIGRGKEYLTRQYGNCTENYHSYSYSTIGKYNYVKK